MDDLFSAIRCTGYSSSKDVPLLQLTVAWCWLVENNIDLVLLWCILKHA